MRHGLLNTVVMGLILIPCTLVAQAPAGAPAGATGKCKDGTYTKAASKSGACQGHKGVATWFATSAPAKSSAAAPAQHPAPTPKPATPAASSQAPPKSASATAKTPAPGGGQGLVWVNTATKVYHCYGTRYYGTTKAGKYMSEAAAKGAGAHPDNGKGCSK